LGWERRGSGRYYYRSERDGERVVKRYFGMGELAAAIAGLEALDRERQEEKRAQDKAERDRLDALDHSVADLSRAVDTVLTEVLTAAGYHRHDRGAWRKRRHKGNTDGDQVADGG